LKVIFEIYVKKYACMVFYALTGNSLASRPMGRFGPLGSSARAQNSENENRRIRGQNRNNKAHTKRNIAWTAAPLTPE